MFVSPPFEHTFYQSLNSPTCQFLALTQALPLLVYRLTLTPRFRLNKATGVIPRIRALFAYFRARNLQSYGCNQQ
jgi:hypothetical protein